MVYDAENRLVSINSGSATYSYDGKSLRVKKVASGTTTVYIFSGARVIAEYQNGAERADAGVHLLRREPARED